MEEEYSEKAKQEFQNAKKFKRTIPDLTSNELVVFAKLIVANASFGEFGMKLNLNHNEVELHKKRTGIIDVDCAKNFLESLKHKDNIDTLKKQKQKQQDKSDEIIEFQQQEEHIDTDKEYNKSNMQKQLDKSQEINIKPSEFTVLPKFEKKFIADALEIGVNFLVDKWSVKRNDIISELNRLKVSLDEVKR